MDHWTALGYFLLGAGLGSLASAALRTRRIRRMKDPLEAATQENYPTEEQQKDLPQAESQKNSQTEEPQDDKPDRRKSA